MHLYQPDLKLPGTRILLDMAALSERIESWLCPSGKFDISIANIRYKPNTSCLVSYKLQTETTVSHFHAKAFDADDWQVRKNKLDDKHNNLWFDDEYAFTAFSFPIDSELPALDAFVRDPKKFLPSVLFDQWDEQLESFETLAYKPNRRLTARLNFASGNNLALKLYDESRFQNALRAGAALKKSLPVATPKRFGRSNRHQALAYQWIHGTTLDISRSSAADLEPLIAQVLRYLDRLHLPIMPAKIDLPLQHPGDGVDAIASYLAVIYPPLANSAQHISREITANLTDHYQPTLIHGDFHEHQIIVSNTGVQACDFDNFCVGDPTADLANFLAHLGYRACLNDIAFVTVDLANALSIRHYVHDQNALSRLVWNRIASLFRLATHPFRSGASQWIQQTEQLLQHLMDQIDSAKNLHPSTTKHAESPQSRPGSKTDWHRIDDPKVAANIRQAIETDDDLSFLQGAFDPNIAEESLRRHCPELEKVVGPYTIDEVIARRHKPGRRCMVEFLLSTDQGPRSVLGKVSARRLDRKTFETQRELCEKHAFDYQSRDGICVPRALACCPPWNMWLQDKVVADSGSYLLDWSQLSPLADRIADAISKLHLSSFCPLQEHTLANELEILHDRLSLVMAGLANESPRIERILQNCIALAERIDPNLKTAIHRDFYQDQIMFADERTYLVDLDLVKLGHPALDVGNFLAHLTEHGIRQFEDPHQWDHLENEIAVHYLKNNPSCRSDEIDACKAISFARHIFISWSRPGRRRWTSQIIEVADDLICKLIPIENIS